MSVSQAIVTAVDPLPGNGAVIGQNLMNPCTPFPHDTNPGEPSLARLCPATCGASLSGSYCFPNQREAALKSITNREITLSFGVGAAIMAWNPIFVSQEGHNSSFGRGYEAQRKNGKIGKTEK